MLVRGNKNEIDCVYEAWDPIKEPALKDSIKMGTQFEIEFRQTVEAKDFKYKDREPPRFFFAVITAQRLPYVLLTQKNKIRYFSEKAAYKWLKELNYSGPCILRSDIEPQAPMDHIKKPTLAQIRGDQPDGGQRKIEEMGYTDPDTDAEDHRTLDKKDPRDLHQDAEA
jgi:hypothetical protein